MPANQRPQTFHLSPTPHVPNSRLPVLVYRSAIPTPSLPDSLSPAIACEIIEPNHWLKGGVFKHYPACHFHSVTHEAYAVFKGWSKIRLGRGPLDDDLDKDVVIDVSVGDVIVLPAGVAHCSVESSDDYEYVGLYPEGSPHWDNNYCKANATETAEKAAKAKAVPIPEYDPIHGKGGPLVDLWRDEI